MGLWGCSFSGFSLEMVLLGGLLGLVLVVEVGADVEFGDFRWMFYSMTLFNYFHLFPFCTSTFTSLSAV